MKMTVAVIEPYKADEVRTALIGAGAQGLMVSEIKGCGRQSGHSVTYRGAEHVIQFLPKPKLDIVVDDEEADGVVETIRRHAHTGRIRDGKIVLLDVEQAMPVRTGERDHETI
jgi:nitrogen regulatory protein P-II 1